jgi:hypothetical protein
MRDTIPEPANGHRAAFTEDLCVWSHKMGSSDGVTEYEVCLYASGKWTCECEGYRYRENCRHIEQARAQLTIIVSAW